MYILSINLKEYALLINENRMHVILLSPHMNVGARLSSWPFEYNGPAENRL